MVHGARAVLHRPGNITPSAEHVHGAQWRFVVVGIALVVLAWVIGRVPALDRWFRRAAVEKLVLVLAVVIGPIAWAEVALRAIVPPLGGTTRIFVRDEELGWRFNPGATDMWGGVQVHINKDGYRGPLIPVARTPGTHRVLYLGDSVTFGYRVAHWQDTFPFMADSLAAALDAHPIETLNLSVEGYSQWQEAIVMDKTGARYRPDMVVLGFVLNDVTEMFHLVRFGGSGEGFQIGHAAASWFERLTSHSAIVYEVQKVTREIKARKRLGEDVRLGAIKQQALDVETLMRRPDQDNVKMAWGIALADLQKIADRCHELDIPFLVVAFPFAVQLSDPAGLAAPQRALSQYASAHGIRCVDMLPVLAEAAKDSTRAPLFLDEDHFSPAGHRLVADLLAPLIAQTLQARSR